MSDPLAGVVSKKSNLVTYLIFSSSLSKDFIFSIIDFVFLITSSILDLFLSTAFRKSLKLKIKGTVKIISKLLKIPLGLIEKIISLN